MNRHTFVVCLALSAAAALAPTALAEPPVRTAADEAPALAGLRTAEHFAIGGVGFAGTTSEGEKNFREVLARPDAVAAFERLLTAPNAGDPARLYALLGLRWKNAPSYKGAVTDLRGRTSVMVLTMQGCIAFEESMAAIATRIGDGKYDLQRETDNDRADAGEATLRTVGTFAIGRVGEEGRTSEGEAALRAILAVPGDAGLRLSRITAEARPAGRLYAVLGLRWLESSYYKPAAASLRSPAAKTLPVRTLSGCKGLDADTGWVLSRIEAGTYDAYKSVAAR